MLADDKWMNKTGPTHMMGCRSALRRNEVLTRATTWMNLEATKGQILDDSTHMRSLEHQIHRDRKYNGGYQGEREGDVEFVFNGDRGSVWEDEKVLEMDGGADTAT